MHHLAGRIHEVQDSLGRRLLLENSTRYYDYPESDMSDGEFLSAVYSEADCDLLLDLNNAWINEQNFGINARDFIAGLPLNRVGEIHLAGHSERNGWLIDSHNRAPDEAVWRLYRWFCELKPGVPCLIEWDTELPGLDEMVALAQRAADIASAAQREAPRWTSA